MSDHIRLAGLTVRVGSHVLLDDVGLELEGGTVVGLVGASGAGKTLTARALLGLVDLVPGVVSADLEVRCGAQVSRPWDACLGGSRTARDRAFRGLRGAVIGYLPQDARAALDPLRQVGAQVAATASLRPGADADPLPHLTRAGFRHPDRVAHLYPHELSGGMAQRVVVAQALARASRFLLADEPATGLDPAIQVQLVAELKGLAGNGIGVLLISHDLRVVASVADLVVFMHRGRVAERLTPAALRAGRAQTPPAQKLIEATRRVAGGRLA